MKILVHGFYGYGNLGDDILLSVVASGLRRSLPAAEISVIVSGPEDLDEDLIQLTQRLGVRLTSERGILDRVRSIRCNDVLVWGGGTCLHEAGQCGFSRNLIARSLNKRVAWLAIGMDDIAGIKLSYAKGSLAIRTCGLITVRDRTSEVLICRTYPNAIPRVRLTADLAWLCDLPDSDILSGRQMLIIAWSGDESSDSDRIDRELSEVVTRGRYGGLWTQVVIAPMASALDVRACERLARSFRLNRVPVDVAVMPDFSHRAKVRLIASAGAFISSRLHPFMIRKILGLPAIAIGSSVKMIAFDAQLDRSCLISPNQIGLASDIYAGCEREAVRPARCSSPEVNRFKAALNFEYLTQWLHEK